MRALLLAAVTLAAIPAAASAAGPTYMHAPHGNYATPHPTYHPPAGHPPMMTYPQHHMGVQRPYTQQQQPRYTMPHDNNAYRNPQVYRHPYNNNQVYYSNNHMDRDHDRRDHNRDFDDRSRHRGYYDYGYPSVSLGYYGGDYGYDDGAYAPDEGYAYDQGYYAPQGDNGYDDQDQGYAGQGYYDAGQGDDASSADDGYADQGSSYQGYSYQQGYASGDQDQAAGPCGRWMWSAGRHQWVWAYCNCPSGSDDGNRW
ncbi:MAG TPA: hypothetical protein VHW60_17420 [Caulobacteraceae bacterium]|nr:hypothetical protein [Caulobacteraceae bacterium]